MDVSDITLSSDWDVVSSAGSIEELLRDDYAEGAVQKDGPADATVLSKGSCVDDILPKRNCRTQSESNSSSDIDVIDENPLDDSVSNISIPSMKISLSSSDNGFTPPLPSFPEPLNAPIASSTQETSKTQELNTPFVSDDNILDDDSSVLTDSANEENRNVHQLRDFAWLERYLTDPQMKQYLLIFFLGFFMALFLIADCPSHFRKQMEERLTVLQAENSKLKNRMLSKIEDQQQKPLVTLEEEINILKSENVKLSNCMKDLIFQMEEQNTLFKKENEAKERELYRNEIDRLKEEVNILQIDNEELQKQLVRVRYGIYSPHAKQTEEGGTRHKPGRYGNEEEESSVEDEGEDTEQVEDEGASEEESSTGNSEAEVQYEEEANGGKNEMDKELDKDETKDKSGEDKNDNSTEILNNEIKELRQKLFSEVEKLKNWKESVQHLMDKLQTHPEDEKQSSGKRPAFDRAKSEEPLHRKGHKKEKKFYDWILRDLQSNLKNTMESLPDVPEFISNFVTVDKKKVKGVFNSVGHYFKKAQDKAKKMFNYKGKKQNDVWNFLGELRKRWFEMKKEFFQKGHKKSQSEDYQTQFEEPSEDHRPQNFHQPDDIIDDNLEISREDEPKTTHPDEIIDDQKATYGQHTFEEEIEDQGNDPNSWVFKRAEYRSELRDEDEELSTNWFLRKKRESNFNANQDDRYNSDDQDVFL